MATRTVRGPLQRLPSSDISTAEAVFKAAMLLLVPDDQTQRKAFESLMPYLYVLRNKGCSWAQLTKLLSDCGFRLQPSTVRTYYSEMLATRQDICQERMNEQILLLAEVRKETKGADMSSISGRISAIMNSQRMMAAPKIDILFGAGSSAIFSAPTSSAVAHEVQIKSFAEIQPVPNNTLSANSPLPAARPDDANGFGLLNSKPVGKKATTKASAFFNQDDPPPVVPDVLIAQAASEIKNSGLRPARKYTQPESISSNAASPAMGLRCCTLQEGVVPLKKRDLVAPEMYLPGDLEHPKIAGLMLSLDERLYSAALEYTDGHGEFKLETPDEKRFRVLWKRPIPMSPTMTGDSFTKMDESLFKKT